MSPNWLSAVGRASPAINQAMTDIEERPRRALRWGWEQEQVGQQKEIFGQQKALNEMTINKMKAEEEVRKEEERLDKAPVPLRTHPFFANFIPEDADKMIEGLRKVGIVTGEKGNEETTGRGLKYFQRMVRENEDVAVRMFNAKDRKLRVQAEDAYNQFLKVTDDPNAPPEKKKKALDTLNAINTLRKGVKEGFDNFINSKRFNDELNTLSQDKDFINLPQDKQYQIMKAAKDAMSTQNYDQYYKARDKAFEEVRVTEKNANIHYETDEKGNTVKIVSHPTTGQTINKENMGQIGKPATEKGQELKIPKLNVVRDLLNEDYANMIGVDKNDVNKRLSPIQKKAYNEIIGLAEKNASTMEPRAALDKALTDWHKKNPAQVGEQKRIHPKYKTAEDVRKAYQKGDLNWEESSKILVDYFGYVP